LLTQFNKFEEFPINFDVFPVFNLKFNMKITSHAEAQSKQKTVTFDKDVKMAVDGNIRSVDLTELWLDKYKPKKYDELLTDEKTNRDILTWLKSWDEIVFKV
jgi:hypothetical protein